MYICIFLFWWNIYLTWHKFVMDVARVIMSLARVTLESLTIVSGTSCPDSLKINIEWSALRHELMKMDDICQSTEAKTHLLYFQYST